MKSVKTNIKSALLLLLLWLGFLGFIHSIKPLPAGVDYRSKGYCVSVEHIDFLTDLTYKNTKGETIHEQEIFDTILALIDNAREYILIDMFLFNSYRGKAENVFRRLCFEVMARLVEKKKLTPSIKIDFMTDPINIVYGGSKSRELELMRAAGINVIYTDLKKLRDSSFLYSPLWRLFIQWFGNSDKGGIFKHPFGENEPGVTLRSYLSLLNFKANHRKIVLSDNGGTWTTVITSANLHDGSSAHSNIALKITGDFCQEVYIAEKSVAEFSHGKLHDVIFNSWVGRNSDKNNCTHLYLVTEQKIEDELIRLIKDLGPDDSIFMAMFYLSDRDIIQALLKAAQAGVAVRIILDPSKDAFGREKKGVPNQPVAHELVKKSRGKIEIRWYHTHGEQFHTKLTLIEKQNGTAVAVMGSANLTRKNIGNFNLELDVKIIGPSSTEVMRKIKKYFHRAWYNKEGYYTVDYKVYENRSFIKTFLYRLYEYTGISTF